MAALSTTPPVAEPDTLLEKEIPRKVWTREEAHLLVELGFPNAEKLELIEGELINRMGKKRPHVVWQHLVQRWLSSTFGEDFVEFQPSIDVAREDNSTSEPEPDLLVTTKKLQEYNANPSPADIRLLIEISDTTVRFDLHKKQALYARAAIVEYWVVDINKRLVHVHRAPERGAYANVVTYGFHEEISPLAAPDTKICLDRL